MRGRTDMTGANTNAGASASVMARLYRFKVLLARRWWILLLAMFVIVCIQGVVLKNRPESYASRARLIVSSGTAIPGGTGNSEAASQTFLPTQVELLQSPNILSRARNRLQTLKPDLAAIDVHLEVTQSRQTDILILRAIGSEGRYTQAYLDAVMEEFLEYRKETRVSITDDSLRRLTDQLSARQKDLDTAVTNLGNFSKENAEALLNMGLGGADSQLSKLTAEVAAWRLDIQVLDRLTPDQQIDKARTLEDAGPSNLATSGAEYQSVKARWQILKDEYADWAVTRKPGHPDMVKLDEKIQLLGKQLDRVRVEAQDRLKNHRASLEARIKANDVAIEAEKKRALTNKQIETEYQSLKQSVTRIQNQYDSILDTIQKLNWNIRVNPETVQILDRATDGVLEEKNLIKNLALGAIAGFILGLGILFLIDRLDDRLTTSSEFQSHIDEVMLGMVPEQKTGRKDGPLKLVEDDDERHSFAEAYRNIRSSLLFLELGDFKPKTFLVTSAIPSEGKSTVTSNIALTFANAGNRVLLIDGDLRRGELHKRFDAPNDAGLTEVLRKQTDIQTATRGTAIANLFLLPRGKASNSASELFLSPAMDALLLKAQADYDFVFIDSAPILATDDSATLAPKIDGVLFVVRASYTSARMVRTALANLHQRGANVLGAVFNRISESMPEYHYYKYTEYYAVKKPEDVIDD